MVDHGDNGVYTRSQPKYLEIYPQSQYEDEHPAWSLTVLSARDSPTTADRASPDLFAGETNLLVSQPQQQVGWVDVITVTLTVNLDARASHVEGRCRSEHPPAAFQGTRVLLDS